jgi:outer membrane protein
MRLESFRTTALAAAVMVFAATGSAQVKLAVVDFQQALLATADMQKKAGELEQKFKPEQDRLAALSQELQDIQIKLGSAAPEEAARLQQEGAEKQRQAQRLTEDLQADIDFDRQQILEAGAERMRAVLDELRASKTLDMIVDVSSTISFNSALDMTADATAAYDAKHPAAPEPAPAP